MSHDASAAVAAARARLQPADCRRIEAITNSALAVLDQAQRHMTSQQRPKFSDRGERGTSGGKTSGASIQSRSREDQSLSRITLHLTHGIEDVKFLDLHISTALPQVQHQLPQVAQQLLDVICHAADATAPTT